MAAYAARAGVKPLVLVPQGKISAGKLAQAIVHGAQVIMVRGNFDDCLRISRGLAEHYPVALVNSVNPMRLQGQKTASFEIVDLLGDAPDVHVLPTGNAGNISAYWLGYRESHQAGESTKLPVMRGWQAEGAAPLVLGAPVPDPETVASAIRIGNPASWDLAMEAADSSGGKFRQVSDTEILAAQRELASRDGVFVEPASAAGVAGPPARGPRGRAVRRPAARGHRDGSRPEGHRHRAVDLHRPRRHRVRRRRRRRGRSSRTGLTCPFVAGPVTVEVPATSANLGPGYDCLGLALELTDTLVGEVDPRGLEVHIEGGGREPPARRVAPGRARHAGRVRGDGRAAAGPHPVLHEPDPAQPGHGLVLRGHRRGHRAGPSTRRGRGRRCSTTAQALSLANRIEGHPDNVAPALLGGFVIAGQAGELVWAQNAPVDPSISAVVFVPPYGVRTEVARGLLPETRCPTPTRPRTPAGRRCSSRPSAAGPTMLLRATEDFLHQRQREPAMPESLALVTDLRARGIPAVVSGAGPTVLAFVAAGHTPAAEEVMDWFRPGGGHGARRSVGREHAC